MSSEFSLRFPASASLSNDILQGPYQLLELPTELCKAVECGTETQFSIRGRSTDDAVLCTASKTYALRTVTLSNTVIVATAPCSFESPATSTTAPGEIIIRDQVSQILELVPSVPKLNRLGAILKGCEYDEGHEQDEEGNADDGMEDKDCERPVRAKHARLLFVSDEVQRKRARFTRESIRGEIQASDAELAGGLKEYHVLEVDGHLRPLVPSYLSHILESLLNAIISEGLPLPPQLIPVHKLAYHLDLEHEIPHKVVEQILPWFGDVEAPGNALDFNSSEGPEFGFRTNKDAHWKMDQKKIVKQIGLGRLMSHKDEPVPITDFVKSWGQAVGDSFAASVDLALLEGNYLVSPTPTPSSSLSTTPTHLTYFPLSALPVTPTHLFADLFVTRQRWRAEDIVPFLRAVAVDAKERDKLLMKYARATTDARGGVWYTARATPA